MQVAVLENGRLAEYFVQRNSDSPISGSIYRGEIESVLPGMQAAFVDIGWERNAYLALEDIALSEELEGCQPNIGDVLKIGQPVVVQIKKEAVDTKGPKVSCKLSLPGKTLVLVQGKSYVAVSKKIIQEQKRQALKNLANQFLEDAQYGLIVRTAAQNCKEEELRQEFRWLLNRWQQLQKKIEQQHKPGLIQADLNLAAQMIRDCTREADLEGIYVNDFALYEVLQQQIVSRNVRFKIRWRECNLIEQFQLRRELETIHKRKVWLKNGGYLIFDRTEALQVVDVNTGKFTGKQNFQTTIVQMNLEAAREIAWQLRLRNLSGIILIDFIDMQQPEDRQQILQALTEALRQDRVKTSVLGMTQLGLVEMTRKKERAPLSAILEQPCPFCQERGRVEAAATVGLRIIADLENECARSEAPIVTIECHPVVAGWLIGNDGKQLNQLEIALQKEIMVRGDSCFAMSNYRLENHYTNTCGRLLPVYRGEVLQVKIEGNHQDVLTDGIARLDGYIIQIEDASNQIGKTVTVEIRHVMKTHAIAQLVAEVPV